jgi:GNAT superfamily N-acetyltransferase
VDDISVVRFVEDDLPFGKTLTDREGWDRTAAIWKRMFRVDPTGFFKARFAGKDAGVAALLRYDRIAWINSVIVLEEYRDKGVGSALMRECLSQAWDAGVETVRLDSITGIEPFYAKFGFTQEYPSLRFSRTGEGGPRGAHQMTEGDLADVLSFDRLLTRMNRARVLESIFQDNPRWAFILRDAEGVRGYLLSSPCASRVDLGPCVCRPRDDACASILIKSVMGVDPELKYRICVCGKNLAAAGLMRDLGFKESVPATRMSQGRRFAESESNYAMISPAEG